MGLHILLMMGMYDGPFSESAIFNGIVALSMTSCFLWSFALCALAGIAQSFSWLWESSSLKRIVSAFSATSCCTSRIWEAYWYRPLLRYPRTMFEIVLMAPRFQEYEILPKGVVLESGLIGRCP